MKKYFKRISVWMVICILSGIVVPAEAQSSNIDLGPETSKDVIYQIITDRFYDGDPTNNIPPGFNPLYLMERKGYTALSGGRLAGYY